MRLNQLITELFEEIACYKEIPADQVCEALEDCMNDVLYPGLHKNVRFIVNNGDFDIYINNGHQPIKLDPSRIPIELIRMIKRKFPEYIKIGEDKARFAYWRPFKGTAREGEIYRSTPDHIEVNLGEDFVGIMPRRNSTNHETYTPGKTMWFYIWGIARPCSVILSRNSISLPAAYLKVKIPLGKFMCYERIVGNLSLIKSTLDVPPRIIQDLSAELGEKIYIIRSAGKKILPELFTSTLMPD